MSFRQRLMLFTALAIAVTVAGASAAVWVVSKHELYKQLDQTLAVQAQGGDHGPFGGGNTLTIHPDGETTGNTAIPVTARALRAVRNGSSAYTLNTVIQKVRVRELVYPFPGGGGGVDRPRIRWHRPSTPCPGFASGFCSSAQSESQ